MSSVQLAASGTVPERDSPIENSSSPVNGEDAELDAEHTNTEPGAKKKKKKKPKKSASAKARDAALATANGKADAKARDEEAGRPPVLCISRNKHWRYISSYHGPWLQLPLELLESLLTLNLDPATLAAPEPRSPLYPPPSASTGSSGHGNKRNGLLSHNPTFPELSPPDSPRAPSLSASITFSTSSPSGNLPPPFPVPEPGKPTPPPIDPGVFRNVTSIRRLIDEAAELSVRASSGLSAAELNMMRSTSPSMNSSSYNSAWSGLMGPGTGMGGGGRNVAMSAMRIHRLRALAVQKLAAAYTADEIASSVMVMQGGSVFDDLAERVLKVDPNDADARYVHFFHEKIPSRQLAESTTTQVLDELIQTQPQKLEYYRTRGIVHCFRDEYSHATKDFTYALKEARAVRKAKVAHHHNYSTPAPNGKHGPAGGKGGKKRKGSGSGKQKRFGDDVGEDAGEEGGDANDTDEAGGYVPHPSVLPDAPTPLEPQLLFLRGAAYLQHAVHLIESTVLKLEGVYKFSAYSTTASDGGNTGNANGANANNGELRLSYLEGGLYGGVEVGNPDGPLGRRNGKKAKAYRQAFGIGEDGEGTGGNEEPEKMREHITGLVKKSMRDHERFLAHFDSLDAGPVFAPGGGDEAWNLAQKVEYAFLLTESIRPGSQAPPPPHPHTQSPNGGPLSNYDSVSAGSAQIPPPATTFTTYHPLLVEAHFSILLCQLMLGDFTSLLTTFIRTAGIVDGLEGYPVFLPPRSMAQAEFVEVLERLAGGWRTGVGPYTVEGETVTGGRGKEKAKVLLAIEGPISEPDADDDCPQRLSNAGSSSSSMGQGSGSSSSASGSGSTVPEATLCDIGPNGTSASSSSSTSPSQTRAATPTAPSLHAQALNSARILLAPVAARQRASENEKKKNAKSGTKKPMSINIPLHGPRVDVILAWLGAVQLPALDAAA
ncbi:hypothetical protein DFH06DRAFT_1165159 [Mycena polygramma]|nr:hypothetical protein DFH06DRAFT_1165159 [Mycena polygramma]